MGRYYLNRFENVHRDKIITFQISDWKHWTWPEIMNIKFIMRRMLTNSVSLQFVLFLLLLRSRAYSGFYFLNERIPSFPPWYYYRWKMNVRWNSHAYLMGEKEDSISIIFSCNAKRILKRRSFDIFNVGNE